MQEHDIECRAKHMPVNTDIDDLEGCDCAFIEKIRVQTQQDIALGIWPLIQPMVDWIAVVNTVVK